MTDESSAAEHRSVRVSRDEMNLAEFPLTVLSTRSSTATKTLEFSDSIRSRNGDVVERHWIITGADKFGLPTSSDDEVLLGLLKLTVDDEFRSPKVYFTRYELLRSLRWPTEGKNYTRLQKALDRLSGVRIKATNAFYDNSSKAHSTANFGIIDAYEINDGRGDQVKPSFFVWSDVLFKSFQVGFIKKLDLDFYLTLQSAISKRLFRYLDKHFWYRSKVQLNLFTLAHEKIGISRNYRYVSSLRQQLDPALEELQAKGFLSKHEYLGSGSATEIALYAALGKPRVEEKSQQDKQVALALGPAIGEAPSREPLIASLVARGLNVSQARALAQRLKEEEIPRVERIVKHFDHLVATKSHLVSKSPVGFLYRAVENPHGFALPDDGRANASDAPRRSPPSPKGREPAPTSREAEYLTARRQAVTQIRQDAEPALLQRITVEVEHALVKIRGLISDSRFRETVEVGVDEKLLKLFDFPDYQRWASEQKRNAN